MAPTSFRVIDHVIDSSYIREYPFATSQDQEHIFKLSVKQYVPSTNDGQLRTPGEGAITIIASGACGIPKETYEPLWNDLLAYCMKRSMSIRGIWMVDSVNMSSSALLNRDHLGDDPSWIDNARDLFLLINQFKKDMPRPLVGIGHSYGANHIVNLALLHPRLLHSVVLLDPSITIHPSRNVLSSHPPYGTLNLMAHRPNYWPSLTHAKASLTAMTRGWDERCIEALERNYFQPFTATSSESKITLGKFQGHTPVRLKTSPAQEVYAMVRPVPPRDDQGNIVLSPSSHPDLHLNDAILPLYRAEQRRTWKRLAELRPSALFVIGQQSRMLVDEIHLGALRCGTGLGGSGGLDKGRVREVFFPDGEHMFPVQKVEQTASAVSLWLVQESQRWLSEEKAWRKERDAKTARGDFDDTQLNLTMSKIIERPKRKLEQQGRGPAAAASAAESRRKRTSKL